MTDGAARTPSARREMAFADLEPWQAFVDQCDGSMPMHTAAWIGVLQAAYRMRARIAVLRECGKIVAGIPFLETRRPLAGPTLVSMPFSDWICPLAASRDAHIRWREALPDFLRAECDTAVVHTNQPFSNHPCVIARVRHALDVDRPYAEVARGFRHGLRTKLRKAERGGLVYRASWSLRDLEQFGRLNTRNRRAWGLPAQPTRFFPLLHDHIIRDHMGFTSIVEQDGKIIAAAVFLVFNKTWLLKYSASDPEFRSLRPNDFLLAHAIRDATESDVTCFDFGASEISNEGLRHFKGKWGARESTIVSEYLVGQPRPKGHARWSSIVRQSAQTAIRSLPLRFATLCGNVVYRYSSGNSW